MKIINIFFIIYYILNIINCPPEKILNTIKEYPTQNYLVSTADNYGIQLFRIQKKFTDFKSGLKPILIVHGITDSSDNFFINKENSIALFLADEGYDVWLMNNRGNKYSRIHLNLKLKSKEFWDFHFKKWVNMIYLQL